MGNARSDTLKTFAGKIANGSVEEVCRDHGDTWHANEACGLQSCLRKVGISITDHLIDSRHFMMELGGDHANEPIILRTGQGAQDKRRSESPRGLVGLGKRKKDDVPVLDYEKDSLISARV